jgi:hypothetical protein
MHSILQYRCAFNRILASFVKWFGVVSRKVRSLAGRSQYAFAYMINAASRAP